MAWGDHPFSEKNSDKHFVNKKEKSMYCPKCGNNVADNATFCPKCKSKIERKGVSAQDYHSSTNFSTSPVEAQQGARATTQILPSNFSGTQILSVVFAAIAVIFALMPWFITSDTLIMAGKAGSAISSFMTLGNYSTANFEDEYTVFALSDFANDLASYMSASYSGSLNMFLIIGSWVVGLICLVVGAILMLLKKNKILLIIGSVIMILLALFYNFVFYGDLVEEGYAESCMNSFICAFASLVALILAAMTKKNAPNMTAPKAEAS